MHFMTVFASMVIAMIYFINGIHGASDFSTERKSKISLRSHGTSTRTLSTSETSSEENNEVDILSLFPDPNSENDEATSDRHDSHELENGNDTHTYNVPTKTSIGVKVTSDHDKEPKNSKDPGEILFDACNGKWPSIPEPLKREPVKQTIVAAYPGSGSKLSKNLIRGITGHQVGSDGHDTRNAITIKTHYPAQGGNKTFKRFENIERFVLLIRNPANAIPSLASFEYEQRKHKGLNHSERMPLDDWLEWRDKNFNEQIQNWVKHTKFWLEHNLKENTLVVVYEHLIDPKTGPDELARLGNFISQTTGIPLVQKPEDIPCLWDNVVNSRTIENTSHRKGGPKRYPYTDEQIDEFVSEFNSIVKVHPEMDDIMDQYITDVLALQAELKENDD